MGKRAILAGSGALPGLLLDAEPARIVRFLGVDCAVAGDAIEARFEQLGGLFDALKSDGVTELCLAGAMSRAPFDPSALDPVTMGLVPRLMAAQGQGDDALLRTIVAILEEHGFKICAAHEIRPDLLASDGAMAGQAHPDGDAARARAVLAALGRLDVGQAAVAAKGQMVGIETLQGTDAMLRFVAETRPGSGGVLVKRAKSDQDLRVDMPAIGPQTVHLAATAGLTGIEVQAGAVLLLDRDAVLDACAETGLSLWGVP